MFTCITMNVMNEFLDNICIHEADINIPKENIPPPLPVTFPKIYPIVVPKSIRYANNSYFIIVFVDVFHA